MMWCRLQTLIHQENPTMSQQANECRYSDCDSIGRPAIYRSYSSVRDSGRWKGTEMERQYYLQREASFGNDRNTTLVRLPAHVCVCIVCMHYTTVLYNSQIWKCALISCNSISDSSSGCNLEDGFILICSFWCYFYSNNSITETNRTIAPHDDDDGFKKYYLARKQV